MQAGATRDTAASHAAPAVQVWQLEPLPDDSLAPNRDVNPCITLPSEDIRIVNRLPKRNDAVIGFSTIPIEILGEDSANQPASSSRGSGTGFIVTDSSAPSLLQYRDGVLLWPLEQLGKVKHGETRSPTPYLITNAHVMNGSTRQGGYTLLIHCVASTRTGTQHEPQFMQAKVYLPNAWLVGKLRVARPHHDGRVVDLAFLNLQPVFQAIMDASGGRCRPFFSAFDVDHCIATDPACGRQKSRVGAWGYPSGLRDTQHNLPLYIGGQVSTDAFTGPAFVQHDMRSDYYFDAHSGVCDFFVNAPVLGGSSGSPIVTEEGRRAPLLLGLLSASHVTFDSSFPYDARTGQPADWQVESTTTITHCIAAKRVHEIVKDCSLSVDAFDAASCAVTSVEAERRIAPTLIARARRAVQTASDELALASAQGRQALDLQQAAAADSPANSSCTVEHLYPCLRDHTCLCVLRSACHQAASTAATAAAVSERFAMMLREEAASAAAKARAVRTGSPPLASSSADGAADAEVQFAQQAAADHHRSRERQVASAIIGLQGDAHCAISQAVAADKLTTLAEHWRSCAAAASNILDTAATIVCDQPTGTPDLQSFIDWATLSIESAQAQSASVVTHYVQSNRDLDVARDVNEMKKALLDCLAKQRKFGRKVCVDCATQASIGMDATKQLLQGVDNARLLDQIDCWRVDMSVDSLQPFVTLLRLPSFRFLVLKQPIFYACPLLSAACSGGYVSAGIWDPIASNLTKVILAPHTCDFGAFAESNKLDDTCFGVAAHCSYYEAYPPEPEKAEETSVQALLRQMYEPAELSPQPSGMDSGVLDGTDPRVIESRGGNAYRL